MTGHDDKVIIRPDINGIGRFHVACLGCRWWDLAETYGHAWDLHDAHRMAVLLHPSNQEPTP